MLTLKMMMNTPLHSSSMQAEAQRLAQMRYPCTGLMLTCDKGQKHLAFPKYWQKAQVDTCVAEFLRSDDNALALLTGDKSDIIALNVDVAKQEDIRLGRADGMQLFKDLIDKHGLPASTPVSQTATGGLHYIFSLSKSLAAGLEKASNQTKLQVDGQESTLDIR